MTTQRYNLTKETWTLIGNGAHDLQREDSKETIYLHFGDAEPDVDTVNHARIVDNGVYSYRGTQNVYARSLDAQAFFIATAISANSGNSNGNNGSNTSSSTKYTIAMTFADDGNGNPVLPTYETGPRGNVTTVNVINTAASWNAYLNTSAVSSVVANGLSVTLSLDYPIVLPSSKFTSSDAAGLVSLISSGALHFIESGCFNAINIESLVLDGVKSINGQGFLVDCNSLQHYSIDADYIYNLVAQVDANNNEIILPTFGMGIFTASVHSSAGDAQVKLEVSDDSANLFLSMISFSMNLGNALSAINSYTNDHRMTQFYCTGLKLRFSVVDLVSSTSAVIKYTLHK